MKSFKNILLPLMAFCLLIPVGKAGNPDRTAQSGASELLVNPWARSVGWNWINVASVRGVDAMRLNVAGLAFLQGSELNFTRSEYLVGWNVGINALGFAQKVGEGAIGVSVVSFDFGSVEITTNDQPEGGLGSYKPQFLNIELAYAHNFADFIRGGIVFKIINESIANVSAQGIAIDAGLIYNTGPTEYPEKFKFGVSLRNIGTPMKFSGDGLNFRADVINGTYQQNVGQLSQQFELPSQLLIGASYDMYLQTKHRITLAGSFTSNAFYKDQLGVGVEYGLKVKNREMLELRAGYKYEPGIFNAATNTNAHNGLSAGFTLNVPFRKDQERPLMGIDYGYRASNDFAGTHSIGLHLNF